MHIEHFARESDHMVRRYEYEDGPVIAVDFGTSDDASVEVVDDTVIVVHEDEQYELDVPRQASDAQAFIKNGVLTIDLEVSP